MVTARSVSSAFAVVVFCALASSCGRLADRAAAGAVFFRSLWLAAVLVPVEILIGNQHGVNTRRYQATKLAAFEDVG